MADEPFLTVGKTAIDAAITAIDRDRQAMDDAAKGVANYQAGLADLAARWSANDIGLVRAAKGLQDWLASLAGSVVSEAVGELETEVRDWLTALVPNSFDLKYDWNTALNAFPAGDPIFSMDRDALNGYPAINDLVLASHVKVTLHPDGSVDRQASMEGKVRAFRIHLIGDAFDLITLHFKGAHFTLDQSGHSQFKADLDHVDIGSLLEFLQALRPFLHIGPVIVTPIPFPPGVQVHFDTGADEIPLGPITFKNVHIYIDGLLPFDDRPAQFRAALASAEKPFEIYYPPYGGGGFVALLAGVHGVLGFEVSLEFSATIALNYSGFSGEGRISAGIYLMQSGEGRILEGFVQALGEGHIACFGIAVNVEIRVRQEGDSSEMKGSATYAFTFRVGFADVTYSMTATHSVQGGGGGGGGGAPMLLTDNLALKGPSGHAADQFTVRRLVKPKNTHWNEYRKRLDL